MDFQPEDTVRKPYKQGELYNLLLKLEFARLIDRLGLHPEDDAPQPAAYDGSAELETVETLERAEELLARWRNLEHVTVHPLPDLSGVCVVWREDGVRHAARVFSQRLEGYNTFLQGLFSPDIPKAAHDCKNLMVRLLEENLSPEGFVFDTAIAAYLLAPTDGSYSLEKLSVTYFNTETAKAASYCSEEAFSPLMGWEAAEEAFTAHAILVDNLQDALRQRLTDLDLLRVHDDIDLPLCPVLARMERAGVLVDGKAITAFGVELKKNSDALEQQIYDLAGERFNIQSPKQLGTILFEKLKLPAAKKTRSGYSTSADVLEKLKPKHPIVPAILEYRQLTKLKSTYVDGLGKLIPPDGRIHTTFQNTVTATGRLSSVEPNLQNIPIRTELGAGLRKMFVAPAGRVLVDADYSQIELRLLACISGDQAMIAGFNSGEDVHTITASQVFGVPQDQVTPLMRRSAKAVNFGIVYGISPFSLSQDIGVSVAQAKEYMDKYFAHYAGVRAYMSDVVEQAKRDGYVSTLFGRRRWVPELKSSNFNTRSFGERVALNAPIQGTAADIIKAAMLRVRDRLRADGLEGRLVLQVHDELIVECPEGEAEAVAKLLKEEMEAVISLPVPLIAETAWGRTWADAH